MAADYLAGFHGRTGLNHIRVMNMDSFPSPFSHRLLHPITQGLWTTVPGTMPDAGVSREASDQVPVSGERQACNKSCDKGHHQGKNKNKPWRSLQEYLSEELEVEPGFEV